MSKHTVSKHTMPKSEFGNYKFMHSTLMNTESLSYNPWSPVVEQEQRAELAQTMEVIVGYEFENEDEFEYITKYHAPINY